MQFSSSQAFPYVDPQNLEPLTDDNAYSVEMQTVGRKRGRMAVQGLEVT